MRMSGGGKGREGRVKMKLVEVRGNER